MNVETITMDPAEAREKLKITRTLLHRRADEEYEALAAGYQALGEGTPLINLPDVIRAGGFDEKKRPNLAIARADRKQVKWERWRGSETGAFDTRKASSSSPAWPTLVRRVSVPPELITEDGPRWQRGYALVPIVPPDVRATVKGQLRDYFILWEVEEWSDRRIGAQPDRDPYLLKHLHGDLYAVVAQWDLTELERAVTAGRAQEN